MILRSFYLLGAGLAILALPSACKLESANDVIRQIDANVAGVYRNADSTQNDGKFVTINSGREVTFLDLRQTGNQLEGIDNNAIIFRGTLGDPRENQVQFNVEGRTTAGNRALISGTISIGEGQGTMRATWIEDNLVGLVYGVANGPTINTNQPPPQTNNIPTNNTGTNININFPFGANRLMTPEEVLAYKRIAQWFCERDQPAHEA
ncbi:MAG TPA: hypothetical protein PKE55_10920 [Kiritimatiellia bacterium]|nr:hypothetical protein [Kiritimatiellia bacterium]